MLTKVIILIFLFIMVPLMMVIFALWMNDLPWAKAPGFKTRLAKYTTENIASTSFDTNYPELNIRQYTLPEEQLQSHVIRAVNELGWELIQTFNDGKTVNAVVTTKLLRFKDDVMIKLEKKDNAILVNLKSASRVGKGDLGANTRHIINFYEILERKINPSSL
ncbi:MAG: DUF1499 domain-containing protein [Pseudomonadota bacterium]